MPGKRRSACTCGSFFYLGIASSLRAVGYRTNTWSHKNPSRYCAKCFMRTGILQSVSEEYIVPLHETTALCALALEISFITTRNRSFYYTKLRLLKFLDPRNKLFGSRNRSVCYTERKFLESVFQEPPDWFHGTDWFATRSLYFFSFCFRKPIYSVHGTDPFATQNAKFLNLYFRNHLTGSTEPIDLPHRTLNSQIYFSGTSLTVSAEPIV